MKGWVWVSEKRGREKENVRTHRIRSIFRQHQGVVLLLTYFLSVAQLNLNNGKHNVVCILKFILKNRSAFRFSAVSARFFSSLLFASTEGEKKLFIELKLNVCINGTLLRRRNIQISCVWLCNQSICTVNKSETILSLRFRATREQWNDGQMRREIFLYRKE